ncbi:uncharacterized protein LOC143892780 [Tasmannia lanceolata]|uniref:uncharacterized protein LOC143892780 n=1 Tax=Tasmannia lanceolata TaxID=3420 RepID=UPI0040629FB9
MGYASKSAFTQQCRFLPMARSSKSSLSRYDLTVNLRLPGFLKTAVPKYCQWIPSDSYTLKLNSDASLDEDTESLGGMISDHKGSIIGCFSVIRKSEPIHHLELEAILQGIILADKLNISKIWIESDSLSAVQVINMGQNCPWAKIPTVEGIHNALSKFISWEISHIWREANGAADYLSKKDYPSKGISLPPVQLPHDLKAIITADSNGTQYLRL